jgi:hypothetical protein
MHGFLTVPCVERDDKLGHDYSVALSHILPACELTL